MGAEQAIVVVVERVSGLQGAEDRRSGLLLWGEGRRDVTGIFWDGMGEGWDG